MCVRMMDVIYKAVGVSFKQWRSGAIGLSVFASYQHVIVSCNLHSLSNGVIDLSFTQATYRLSETVILSQ